MQGIVGQACVLATSGRRVCLAPGETSATGVFTVVVPQEQRCAAEIALRVFDRSRATATVYAMARDPDREGVVYATRDVVMFALDPAANLPAAGDASAQRTIALAAGIELRVAPAALDDYAALAARMLDPDEAALAGLGGGETLDTVVALGPEQSVRGGAASLRIPTRLAAGSSAEILVLGGLYTTRADGSTVGEGTWERIALAQVADDGSVSTAGGPLSALGWVGVRASD